MQKHQALGTQRSVNVSSLAPLSLDAFPQMKISVIRRKGEVGFENHQKGNRISRERNTRLAIKVFTEAASDPFKGSLGTLTLAKGQRDSTGESDPSHLSEPQGPLPLEGRKRPLGRKSALHSRRLSLGLFFSPSQQWGA